MAVMKWPGREAAEASRQWPTIVALAEQVDALDGVDGLVLLGSFARGAPDELSDIDALAVTVPGRFRDVWKARHQLARDPLVTWESQPALGDAIGWFKWLTRDLVKVECGVVDATGGGKDLAEPYVVAVGDASVAARFGQITAAELAKQRRAQADQPVPDDPMQLPYGELIDWKWSEMKNAVRRGLQSTRES